MIRYRLHTKRKNVKQHSEKAKKILAIYLAKGLTLQESCILANIDKYKLNELRTDPDFDDFVKRMNLKTKAGYLDVIKEAAESGSYGAATWWLERKYPDEFAKVDKIKHEFTVKINTLQKVILEVINEESPTIKYRILSKLRNYNFENIETESPKLLESSNGNGENQEE